jgi:antitoxin (DNA-binding transcriptional repressor) of toxin-antitoxin stability system
LWHSSYKKMAYIGAVSIRELRQNLRRVLARVDRGEVVEVRRRRKTVARLAPVRRTGPVAPWPDLKARRRAVLGDGAVARGGSDIVIEGRADR